MLLNSDSWYYEKWLDMLDKLIDEFVEDDEVKALLLKVQALSSEQFGKIEDAPFLKPILWKLFRIIPANKIGTKNNLMLPKQNVKMSVLEILLLFEKWLHLKYVNRWDINVSILNKDQYDAINETSFLPQLKRFFAKGQNKKMSEDERKKNFENLQLMIKEITTKYYVEIDKAGKWKKIIWPKDWDNVFLNVNFEWKEVEKNYQKLKDALNKIFSWSTKEEWIGRTDEIQEHIKKEIETNLRIWEKLKEDMFWKQVFNIPNNSIFDEKTAFFGKDFLNDESHEVLELQKWWHIPTLFDQKSLLKLKQWQDLVVLLDISWSTETYDAYKLLDIAAAQAIDFINQQLWSKIDTRIITFSSNVEDILSKMDWFIHPTWWTSNEIWMYAAIEYFKLINKWVYTKTEFEKILKVINEFFDWLWSHFYDSINDLSQNVHNVVEWKQVQDVIQDDNHLLKTILNNIKKNSKVNFQNSHILSLTDWLPNNFDETILMAKVIWQLNCQYSQIVTAYDLSNVDEIVQASVLEWLWWDHLKNMADSKKNLN